jgi:predicted restriction endonuclease
VPIDADKLNLVADLTSESQYEIKLPNITERSGLVTSRVGQGAYRKRIIHRWEYQCAVTGFNKLEVLIASHILPWKMASDEQRLDVDNGLLLSPTFDALFDRHLISFENNGSIILSDSIETDAYAKIGITGNERLRLDVKDGVKYYLEHHQNLMFGNS